MPSNPRLSQLSKQIRLLTAELQDVTFGGEDFLPDEVEIANRTSRTLGAVGAKALVPRVVREWIQPTDKVLDFGAGKDAAHTMRLRSEGFNVTAHEFGKNQQPGLHDPNALQNGPYDVVYASNVLNVQSTPAMLTRTLLQIRRALKPGGIFIGNFPKQPRKMPDFTPAQMAAKISEVFGVDAMTVKPGSTPKVGRVAGEPVFFVRYKGFKGQPAMEGPVMSASTTKTQKAVKAAVDAIEFVRKAKAVKAKFMQPQVVKGDVLVVETDDGTVYIPASDARGLMTQTRNSSPEEVNTAVAEFLGLDADAVTEVSIEKGKFLARSSAPGYMDSTDWSMFDTEVEAWEYLIDMDGSLFTWTVELTADAEEGGTAHIYMDSDAAAKAMQDAVSSLGGSKVERDGDFVYVGLTGNGEEVMQELQDMGFDTEEG